MFFGFDVFAIVFLALAVLTLFAGVKTVPQGYQLDRRALRQIHQHAAVRASISSCRSSTASAAR